MKRHDKLKVCVENPGKPFPNNFKELRDIFFDKKKISQDDLICYLWSESYIQKYISLTSDKKCCEYLITFIKMAIALRDDLQSNRKYDFYAEIFG